MAAKAKQHWRLQVVSRALLTSALFYACSINAGQCPADHIDESATVRYVHDGDTIRLTDGRKLRLIGINTPELARKQKPAEAYAKQAKNQLIQLLKSSNNQIGLRYGRERKDKYQRTLAHIYLPDGSNLQARLLSKGLATAYSTPPNNRQTRCYYSAEQQARSKKTGIWSLSQYQVKSVNQLNKRDRGFRIIKGRVNRLGESKKGRWLYLDNNVTVRIPSKDLIYFSSAQLQHLQGRRIQVRGWLHPNKKGFFMNLRHPSALQTLD